MPPPPIEKSPVQFERGGDGEVVHKARVRRIERTSVWHVSARLQLANCRKPARVFSGPVLVRDGDKKHTLSSQSIMHPFPCLN